MKFFYGLSAAIIGATPIIVLHQQLAVTQEQQTLLNDKAIGDMARDVTVLINGQNPGSGAIVSKQGNTYYVLTAKHVVATQDEYEIVTSDAQKYPINYATVKKLPGVDLALVQFTSNKNYRVAALGDSSQISEGATVYTAGWPRPGRAITQAIYQITKGSISGRPLQALEDGYGLVYTNITRSGMSGGPVLDAQGRVVGIHGRAEGEPILNPDTGATVDVKSGFNLAIPIDTFIKLAPQQGINLTYLRDKFAQASTFPTGTLAFSVAISFDGQIIAAGLGTNAVKLWDRSTGKELRTFTGHSQQVNSVAISADGQILASGSRDYTVKIWNLRSGQLLHTLTGHERAVRTVAFSPDSKVLASGSELPGPNFILWDVQTGKQLRRVSGYSDFVLCLAFTPDGTNLINGGSDRTVKIWNPTTGELIRSLPNTSNPVYAVAVSPYGQILASSNYQDGSIKIWNRNTGELVRTLTGHSDTVASLAIDPNGHLLASGSYDSTIKIWNLHTGQLLHTLEVRNRQGVGGFSTFSLAFSADGQTLVSGGNDGTVKVWQMVKR